MKGAIPLVNSEKRKQLIIDTCILAEKLCWKADLKYIEPKIQLLGLQQMLASQRAFVTRRLQGFSWAFVPVIIRN